MRVMITFSNKECAWEEIDDYAIRDGCLLLYRNYEYPDASVARPPEKKLFWAISGDWEFKILDDEE